MKRRISHFCTSVLLILLAACTSLTSQEIAVERVDDGAIASKVKTAISREPLLKTVHIEVESVNGVVQLSGFVTSRAAENKVVELARAVKGVKAVRNEMRLK